MSVASTCNCGTWFRKGIDCAPTEHASDCPVWGFPTTSRSNGGERVNDTDAAGLREQIAAYLWCGIGLWERAEDCDRELYWRMADAVLALPALQRLVEQAAEAARLRDFAVEMINHPDDSAADWGYDLAHRLGMLDVGGSDA
jgi:hypothetical protein